MRNILSLFFSLVLVVALVWLVVARESAAQTETYPRVVQTEQSGIASALERLNLTVGTTPTTPTTAAPATTTAVADRMIYNRSGSAEVCWTALAPGTTCSSSGMTCSGAATDGAPIAPGGAQRVKLLHARARLCIVASGAGTSVMVHTEVIQ